MYENPFAYRKADFVKPETVEILVIWGPRAGPCVVSRWLRSNQNNQRGPKAGLP